MQVLFILFTLFVAVKGIEQSGLIAKLSGNIESGKYIPLKLILTTFFLSMLITNDVALIVIVPLTLTLSIRRLDILVILEALAANAGSALTPFGNPQNFFIYWFYDVNPAQFIVSIAPFSLLFLVLLILSSLAIQTESNRKKAATAGTVQKSIYIYPFFLIIVLLTVFRIFPVVAGSLVLIYALLLDRKALRVDYALLFSFFFFFGLADNMRSILLSEISHAKHVFFFSALASQIMSNVPTALLFAKFTTHWKALLWGTNAGGFGSLFGSLANLIAYKLYVTHEQTNNSALFTAKFLIIGYMAFFIAIGLYFALPGFQ